MLIMFGKTCSYISADASPEASPLISPEELPPEGVASRGSAKT